MACACVPRPRPALSVVGGWVGRGLSGRAGWSLALACLPGGGAGWCLAPPSFGGLGGVAGLCAGFGAPPSPLLKYYLRRGLPSCGLVPWAGLGAFASAWPSVRPLLGRGLCVVGGLVRCRGLCLWCLRVWGGCGGFVGPRPPPPVPPGRHARAPSVARGQPKGGPVSGGRGPPRGACILRALAARAALAGGNGIQKVLRMGKTNDRRRDRAGDAVRPPGGWYRALPASLLIP